MTDEMTAYCGLNCNTCPAYIAKRTDDEELRNKTAAKWSTPDFPVTPEDINCDGCKTLEGTKYRWCESCEILKCAEERGVQTCAHCEDYSCEKLQKLLQMIGEEAQQRLDSIRSSL